MIRLPYPSSEQNLLAWGRSLVSALEFQNNRSELQIQPSNQDAEDQATAKAFFFDGNNQEIDLVNLNADNLTSGTVPSARISGSYTGITGTGALNAGSITSGFGNIDNGTSTLTSGNTDINGTLDVSGDATFDTSTLKVDSSNNRVGIGTASPDSLLTVQSSGATTAKIDTSSSSSYAELLLEDGNAGYAIQTRSDNAQSTGTGSLVFNDRDSSSFPIVVKEGNATNTLVLDSSKVGLGIDPSTLPSFISHAMKVANGGGLSITSPNASDNRLIFFGNGTSSSDVQLAAIKNSSSELMFLIGGSEHLKVNGSGIDVTGTTTTDNLTVEGSGVNFTVNQTANNLTASFIGAGLGTMELQGTSSGAFIDMKQGDNDFDVRFGGNNAGGYIANNSASFSISGIGSFTATIVGALSKSSGSFKIDHPLESKKNTHHLFHSFVESPKCDNIYRGKVDLVDGTASVNIDTIAKMTEGTFVALNRDTQCFTTNETGWTAIKGSVNGNILTIIAQDNTCTDTISWLVIGERQDNEIKESSLTDDDGYLVVEKLKSESAETNQNYGNI